MRSKWLVWVAMVALGLSACGDDDASGVADPPAEPDPQPAMEPEPMPDPMPTMEPTPTPDPQPAMEPEPMPDPEPVMEPDPEPVMEPDPEPEVPMGACVADEDCAEDFICLEEVCQINMAGRAYIEFNYILEEPSALTNAISVFKGFFGDIGFFMIEFAPVDDEGLSEMTYGGADQVLEVEEGPDVWAWQLPDELPSVQVHRMVQEDDPFDGTWWQSDPFDYQLVALFGDGPRRSRLGFTAAQTTLTMQFSDDLSQIITGRLDGFITREEAESRRVDFAGNCILALAMCPVHDCGEDPPFETLSDILDCNEVVMDADIDPNLEGHDAYRASIFFESELVTIEEEQE